MVASEYRLALSTIENSRLEVDCHIVKTLRDVDLIVFSKSFLLYTLKEKD